MILVPVKNLGSAKQRLASMLDQSTRTELAHAMLRDVLEALSKVKSTPVALVTSDVFALALARNYGFEIIPDSANKSETDAIEMATQVCESRGIRDTLVLPGDVPLVTAEEVERILAAAPEQGSVLVPSADQRGTNAAYRRPAGLFPLRFGNDSFQPHLSAARATGLPCVVIELPGIALDIDTLDDLLQLAAAPGEAGSQRLVREWDLTQLPRAANE